MDQTFTLTGPINLSVRLGHGSLLVEAVPDLSEAVVEIDATPAVLQRLTVALHGPTLTVHDVRQGGLPDLLSLGRGAKSDSVHAVVRVPAGTAMTIATFTATITVRGRSAGADVASAAGAITLDEVDGDLGLRYGGTSSHVGRVTGSVRVRSGAGNASFGEIGGDLHAGCGRGALTVATVHGTVRARSGAGTATLGAVHGDVDLASGSGGMSIGLPAGVTARLDVVTGSGRVRTDLPVTDHPADPDRAITVRARTGHGDVHLFRAA